MTPIAVALGIIILGMLTKFKNDDSSSSKEEKQQQPYRNWNHPEKTTLDKILSIIFPYLIDVEELATFPSHNNNNSEKYDKRTKVLTSLRTKLIKIVAPSNTAERKKWNTCVQTQKSDDFLICGTVCVPRNEKILSKLLGDDIKPPPELKSLLRAPDGNDGCDEKDSSSEPMVMIELTCPSSAILSGIEFESSTEEEKVQELERDGSRRFKTCNLKDISFHESSQIFLWFHGGGLVMNDAVDNNAIENVNKVCEQIMKRQDKNDVVPTIVVMSLDYRLAPENPFPAPIIDGLSASTFLIEHYSSLRLHVGGISAGGYLSSVIGFETHRAFPGKIQSILVDAPMIQPSANSPSYYLQSKSSGTCPVAFLRWSWSAYLQLDESQDESVDFYATDGIHKALEKSTVWSKLYERGNGPKTAEAKAFWRLVCPASDPPALEDQLSPNLFIITSTADPLHDDGVELVNKLREKCKQPTNKIHHFDLRSSHAISSAQDPKNRAVFTKEWSKSF